MPINNLTELVAEIKQKRSLEAIAGSASLQFGTAEAPYLGAELMPEQIKSSNAYTEWGIEYFSLIGNSGSDYSPSQLNPGGQIVGSFDVKFGKNDQADTMSAQAYDAIRDILEMSTDASNNRDKRAVTELLSWFDKAIAQPLIRVGEKHRWDAIIDAQVLRTGSNGYQELVRYSNPVGQRISVPSGTVAAPTGWFGTDATYNLLSDILAIKRSLKAKGKDIVRIISNYEIFSVFMNHAGIRNLFMGVQLTPGTNQFSPTIGVANEEEIGGLLRKHQLPNWTVYDRTYNYRNAAGAIVSEKYLNRATYHPIVIIANTGMDQRIDLGLANPVIIRNTLGCYGIGRLGGQARPGRVTNNLMTQDQYPEILRSEMLEMALPVITSPQSIYVLKIMKPTP